MARLYEWEAHLTDEERDSMSMLDDFLASNKHKARVWNAAKDEIRRKCVQRARNAQAKLDRAAYRAQNHRAA